jgi:Sec-independent protein translocase protein TatA
MALGWTEMLALGALALLIFGKDLPQVARRAGRILHELQSQLKI